MSGLVVGYGQPERTTVEKMFEKIEHRGPDVSGIWEHKQAIMAQNYLKADLTPPIKDASVPLAGDSTSGRRICYDGQMGNTLELSKANGIGAGPFREERVLLRLYEAKGPEMFSEITDGIFAMVISDGENFLAARDLRGLPRR